ncbi:hypothetical protein Hena1_02670 [Erwinia phage Hena1]|uniref:Uncharacterized protein n=1 Tax=Erwinia phage Hena1 TaxID=2678601 RepID=A0A6B9JIL6_9CAUD|nr:hypothetical protein HWC84_gp097 [Erwinia phage Hena1]QGZ16417.1 hypothetical protein Hena1_02670 [Erwinia phage Hena1]
MKNVVYQLSKTNLLAACGLACVVGFMSNTIFNGAGTLAFDADSVNITNNVIDVMQLAAYTMIKLSTVGRLTRYDLPPILGGLTSLML